MQLIRISKHTAYEFYSQYEHLGNSGLGIWHYGLFENNILISVISFGTTCFDYNRGFLGYVAKKNNMRIIQLARGGTRFDADFNIPSQIIKLALAEIRKEFGNILVIAYSDVKWNEIGTIYQACNFQYLGVTDPGGQCNYIINGKQISGWVIRKKYGTRNLEKLRQMGIDAKKVPLTPKHRYLYINASPLKKKFVTRECSSFIKSYPKRSSLSVGSMLEIRERLNLGERTKNYTGMQLECNADKNL